MVPASLHQPRRHAQLRGGSLDVQQMRDDLRERRWPQVRLRVWEHRSPNISARRDALDTYCLSTVYSLCIACMYMRI